MIFIKAIFSYWTTQLSCMENILIVCLLHAQNTKTPKKMHLPYMKMPWLYTVYLTAWIEEFQSIIWPVSVITKNKIIMLIEPQDSKFLSIHDLRQIQKGEFALFELQHLTE